MRPSVGRTGVCSDNAVAESFWESLKRECLQGRVFATRAEARRAIFRWINWYNTTRLHSTLDHRTPRLGTAVPSSVITTVQPTARGPWSGEEGEVPRDS